MAPAAPPGVRLPVWVQTLLFGRFRPALMPILRRRYGDVFTIRVAPGSRELVALADPADVRTVFAGTPATFHAGEGNAILGTVMGRHSVLLLDEDQHRRVRKLLMPAFHGAALHGYRDLITGLAKDEVERWPAGPVFRAHDRMRAVTLEIILRVVFGVTDPARLDALRPLVRRITDIGVLVMLGWFYPELRRFDPWRGYLRIQVDLDRLLHAEIAHRRHAPDLAERPDVLSRLLRTPAGEQGEEPLSDAELRDQLVTLLLAGHETTATALAWTLHELARRPDQQRAARRAADDDDEEYLTAVVKEALRLRPVIFEVVRKLTEPIDLGGYRIAAGSLVAPMIGLVQSDPANHDEPDQFRPERFLGGQPAPNTWIPFGGGVRRCLGAGFSLMEATTVLREVLRRYDIRPDRTRPERRKARNISLVPARGARISINARNTGAS